MLAHKREPSNKLVGVGFKISPAAPGHETPIDAILPNFFYRLRRLRVDRNREVRG